MTADERADGRRAEGAPQRTLAPGYGLVIFDLDGVVYLGSEPVPGAAEAIQSIVDGGTPVAFVTNNASRRGGEVAALLRSLRVPARDCDVLTSGQAAAEVLANELPAGSPVLVVGAPALREEIAAVGLTPVDRAGETPVAVVQGYGPEVGWGLLAEACVAIRAGARWVVTNTDPTMPSPRGPLPGNGSLVAALSTALDGRVPDDVVGKPAPTLFRLAVEHRAALATLVVGDRLDTDIEGAHRAGLDSLLVLTGVSTPADVLVAIASRRPTYLAADCRALALPAADARVPGWDGEQARDGRWRVTREGDRLLLHADDQPTRPISPNTVDDRVAALRAIAAAAWAGVPAAGSLDRRQRWPVLAPDGPDAAAALAELGLRRLDRREVSAS